MRSEEVFSRMALKPSGPTSRRAEPSRQMTKGRKSIDQVTLSAVTCRGIKEGVANGLTYQAHATNGE
jgi:hypothetical protein